MTTDDTGDRFVRGMRRGEPLVFNPCVEAYELCSTDDMECLLELVLKDEGCFELHPEEGDCPNLRAVTDRFGENVEQIEDAVFDPITGHVVLVFLDLQPLLLCIQ